MSVVSEQTLRVLVFVSSYPMIRLPTPFTVSVLLVPLTT
jgi:hypothetical protein